MTSPSRRQIKKYKDALRYIADREYLTKLGHVETLQKWIREFIDVAKKALEDK
jgi:hypothetical protein